MTLSLKPKVSFADGPNLDAFSRLRVSSPTLLLEAKRVGLAGENPQLGISSLTSGSGVLTAAQAHDLMTVQGNAVGTVVRASKSRAVYQPGKSLLVFITYQAANFSTGVYAAAGYFDGSDGFFVKHSGLGVVELVKRSSISGALVDTAIAQANWNLDKLDGTGKSGITLDPTAAQILVMDLEWLGAGRVRIGFVVDGSIVYAHEFNHANIITTGVYMGNPNLTLRWQIVSAGTGTAGAEPLLAICGQVSSEGGYEINGVNGSADMGTTIKTIGGSVNAEILAIRIKAANRRYSTAFAQAMSVLAASASNFLWKLVVNPTETAAGAWSDVATGLSVMEKNTTRTVTANTGLTVASGYVATATNAQRAEEKPILTLGETLAGVGDVYSLQVLNLGAGNEDYLGSLTWREAY